MRKRDMGYEPVWNQRAFYELLKRLTAGKRWLDLGCGRDLRSPQLIRVRSRFQESLYIGTDLDMDSLRENSSPMKLCADATQLPFPDKFFDVVSSNMVFEHLPDPVAALREMNRILRDDGVIAVHCASSLHGILMGGRLLSKFLPKKTYGRLVSRYTGREEKDIFPTRYRANTALKLSRSARLAGLHPILLSYLETPNFFPPPAQWLEAKIQPYAPGWFKGTLLAICLKTLN